MKYPLISVVIATYNSEHYVRKVIKSVKNQNYRQDKIEILIIDGGSSDRTIKIAREYKCLVYNNPKRLQVFGKQIGALKAKGEYLVFLDSDEVLVDRNSFNKKIETFTFNKNVKAVLPSGYKTPNGVSSANLFVNEFGDPFSYFMYGVSINSEYFFSDIKKIANKIYENKQRVIFDFSKTVFLPALELSAIGVFVERKWLLKTILQIKKHPSFISQSFYYLVSDGALLGITKNDFVLHYSVYSWAKYLKKIKSRVINNVYKTKMGMSAFSGRKNYYPAWFQAKKYLFIPYSFSIIFPLIEAVYLSFSRRELAFLAYPFLCLYTSFLILFYYSLKFLGFKIKINVWGS